MKGPWLLSSILAVLLVATNAAWFRVMRREPLVDVVYRIPVEQGPEVPRDGPGKWVKKAAFAMPLVPESLRVDPYIAAVVQTVAFLELSDEEAVNPDAAIEAIENVSAYLGRLSPDQ